MPVYGSLYIMSQLSGQLMLAHLTRRRAPDIAPGYSEGYVHRAHNQLALLMLLPQLYLTMQKRLCTVCPQSFLVQQQHRLGNTA